MLKQVQHDSMHTVILNLVQDLSARELSGSLGIMLRQCERILASMKQKGLIERIGANKGGCWKVLGSV